MQVVTADLVKDKKVLLRIDIDVPSYEVADDFRLQANLETIELCLHNASQVILMGHIGRPESGDKSLSVGPIVDWLEDHLDCEWNDEKLKILENLRFESGEDDCDLEFAKKLAELGEFFVFEAFAAHHKAASTIVLPTLLPHAAGLNFVREVREVREIRENPKRPLIALVGGAKVEDKYPAVLALAEFCDTVLVGGLIGEKVKSEKLKVKSNMILGGLNASGMDLSSDSIKEFSEVLRGAGQVIWVGPMGKYEDPRGNIANNILADVIIEGRIKLFAGGGDSVAMLRRLGKLRKLAELGFISTGGGASLEFLAKGTLPTVQALE